ncbi:MAG: hypothetical protein JSS43_09285 [Proteobacteria bacterium]|nr:hypothetical protein [Pseudomonadota bacterium]
MSGSQTTAAQPVTPGTWIDQSINGMQYKVLLPANYDPSIKYPTLLYLHALDMGLYPDSLVSAANNWFNTTAFRTAHPSIIVMPLLDQSTDQSGQTINWGGVSTASTAGELNAIAALKQVLAKYSTDASRVYVTGNSMGGIGTEDMLIKFNAYTGTEGRIFAAGLALAGADYGQGYPQPNQSVVTALKNVPFWAIHGAQDTQVRPTFDQNLYAAEQAIGGVMKYTQDASLGHDVWDTYYPQTGPNSPLSWLYSQSSKGVVTPSPNNTVVLAGSTAAITDAAGNKWTIVNGAVQENGKAAGVSSNVIEIAYVDGAVWQENASKLWWKWDGSAWSGNGTATSPLPAPPPTESANATVVLAGSTAAIIDAAGNKWTIVNGAVQKNGAAAGYTANVKEIAYVNHAVWQENTSNLWWKWDGSAWSGNGTATSPLPAAATTQTTATTSAVVPTESANATVVTTGSTAAIVDASGNKWTIVNGAVQENGKAAGYTANVKELAYVNHTVWQENASNLWWSWNGTGWSGGNGTATSPLPANGTTTSGGTTTTTGNTTMPGTRDPSQIPFASDSVFNLPIGSGAKWTYNAQLAGAKIFINTAGNYNENIWTGTASDPLVTITNTATAGGTPGTFKVHIPVGAVPAGGSDQTFTVDDTTTHTWYSFGGFNWTGSNTATARQGSGESDYGSGIQVDNSNWDQGVGTLRQSDLDAGAIHHMLRIELPTSMLLSYSSSAYQLAPNAWPQTQEDGFGPQNYTGTVPYGVTLGIASTAVEPAAVAANAGADMLWHALRNHGAMIRDSGGSGNTVIFQTDQNVNFNDPLIQGMIQYGSQIMSQVQILANQGPNSVNGGGTPIVPLIPNPSDLPTGTSTTGGTTTKPVASPNDTLVHAGATTSITDAAGNKWTITASDQVAVNGTVDATTARVTELAYVDGVVWQENADKLWWGKSNPAASWSPSSGTSTSPLPAPVTLSASQGDVTVTQSQIQVVATAGTRMLFIKGSGDTIAVSGGTNTITDTGQGNTYVLPIAGKGSDVFTSNVFNNNDWLDLRPALAATSWNGVASSLPNYLHVTNTAQGAAVSIVPSGSGSGSVIATIQGASNTTLTSLLAHSLT